MENHTASSVYPIEYSGPIDPDLGYPYIDVMGTEGEEKILVGTQFSVDEVRVQDETLSRKPALLEIVGIVLSKTKDCLTQGFDEAVRMFAVRCVAAGRFTIKLADGSTVIKDFKEDANVPTELLSSEAVLRAVHSATSKELEQDGFSDRSNFDLAA